MPTCVDLFSGDPPVDASEEIRSLDEVRTKLASLTKLELLRLERMARHRRLATLGMDADDLVQESIKRVLRGTRKWPINTEFMPFMAGVMRSVSTEARTKDAKMPHTVSLGSQDDIDKGAVIDPIDTAPTPEEQFSANERKQKIINALGDDLPATIIFEGMMEGMDGQELRALTALDQIAYDSKRKKVRRHLNLLEGEA